MTQYKKVLGNFDSVVQPVLVLSYNDQIGDTVMKREAVQQWLDLQFGLFIHFGLYSIPAECGRENHHPGVL
jgi:hypothetical protein